MSCEKRKQATYTVVYSYIMKLSDFIFGSAFQILENETIHFPRKKVKYIFSGCLWSLNSYFMFVLDIDADGINHYNRSFGLERMY